MADGETKSTLTTLTFKVQEAQMKLPGSRVPTTNLHFEKRIADVEAVFGYGEGHALSKRLFPNRGFYVISSAVQ
jgi:hypothetical protein